MKTGVGTASARSGDLVVGVFVVVNAFGDLIDPETGEILAGTLDETGNDFAGSHRLYTAHPMGVSAFVSGGKASQLTSHSTIGVVASNARLDKAQAHRVAMMAHDGYARAIVPVHTHQEGDIIFSVVTGIVEANVSVVGALAAEAMARAIANAARSADSAYGYTGYREMAERRKRAGR
jgi:L-aminopeptidase/D-esterase-like protein